MDEEEKVTTEQLDAVYDEFMQIRRTAVRLRRNFGYNCFYTIEAFRERREAFERYWTLNRRYLRQTGESYRPKPNGDRLPYSDDSIGLLIR